MTNIMKSSVLKLTVIFTALLFLSACASNNKVVPRHQSLKSISYGTISDAEEVTIGGSRSGIGAYVVSAAAIHDATSRSFFGFLGRALLGSAVGAAVEERVTRKAGMRYLVDTSNGRAIEVLSRKLDLKKGDCVEIIRSRRDVDIRPTSSGPCAAPAKPSTT